MADAPPDHDPRPRRSRLQRTKRAVRSTLRRYPSAIVDSLRTRDDGSPVGVTTVLHELAPHDLAVCWLGHASVVAQFDETVVAADPVLSSRIGPRVAGRTIGLPRTSPAPLAPAALRGVDLVLITHAHFDHLDKPTLAAMADERTTVIVPNGCARLVPPGYARVRELDAGGAVTVSGVKVTAITPNHWGARVGVDRRRGVNGYHVDSIAGTVLFAGDTAATDAFDAADDSESIDIAVFGIGAYDPWEHMHATPEQAWSMFQRCGARFLLPVHHSTFELSDEPPDDPMARLRRAAGATRDRILESEPGEVVVVPRGSCVGHDD